MERMMPTGAPLITPERERQLRTLQELAALNGGGQERLARLPWQIEVERSDVRVLQIVARGQGCQMLANPGFDGRCQLFGAVDAFFLANGDLLDQLAA